MPFGKGGPAGAYKARKKRGSGAVSALQKRFRARRAKKGLNLVEKQQVKRIIKLDKETKYARFNSYDVRNVYGLVDQQAITSPPSLPGVQNNANGGAGCIVIQTGAYKTPASVGLDTATAGMPGGDCVYAMGGYTMTRGDTNRDIDGDYAISQSQLLSINVSMNTIRNQNQWQDSYLPVDFRVLYVRAKPHSESQSASLTGGLFLNQYGQKAGLASPNLSAKFIATDARINPGQWEKVEEFNFTLAPVIQPPGELNTPVNSVIPNYPLKAHSYEKQLTFWLDKPKKRLKFGVSDTGQYPDGGGNNFEPMNYDFNNYIVILATSGGVAQNGTADGLGWSVRASGTSKFRDV